MAKHTKPKTTEKTTSKESKKSAKTAYKSYQSFRLQKKMPTGRLPGAFRLFWSALGMIKRNWKVFGGIILAYGILNLLLVQGVTALSSISEDKTMLEESFSGSLGELAASATLFVHLLGASSTVSPAAGVYQLVLTLTISLALIWTLRQLYAKNKVRIRDGFYQGMYPLVPFVLVLCVIGLQLIPMILGGIIYSAVISNAIAVGALEIILWAAAFFMLALVSLYMLCSSLFALYVVCLPGVTPLQALRSARALVLGRRWTVLRKIIFLPVVILLIGALLLVPLILFATPAAAWVFFVYSMLSLAIIHSYMYGLYRSLL